MLEFAHKPPRSLKDVQLSEAGKFSLDFKSRGERSLEFLGEFALIQVIDAFGVPLKNKKKFEAVLFHVHKLAEQELDGSTTTDFSLPYDNDTGESIIAFNEGLGLDGYGSRVDYSSVQVVIDEMQGFETRQSQVAVGATA